MEKKCLENLTLTWYIEVKRSREGNMQNLPNELGMAKCPILLRTTNNRKLRRVLIAIVGNRSSRWKTLPISHGKSYILKRSRVQ